MGLDIDITGGNTWPGRSVGGGGVVLLLLSGRCIPTSLLSLQCNSLLVFVHILMLVCISISF